MRPRRPLPRGRQRASGCARRATATPRTRATRHTCTGWWLNLLDNAIKYSPEGACVRVSLRREGVGYRLAVRDSGPPVAPELRERIFERFFRSDAARAAGGAGAGLGLAIARWVAEAHGGSLVLAPPGPDGGNEFVLRLPLPRPPA